MKLTSPEFEHNQVIPKKYSCDGDNVNPPLHIEEVPPNTKSLGLIVDDPDAPSGTFVHWVVYDMPVMRDIAEKSVPGKQGTNSRGQKNYSGPCPPSGTHRYFFKLYALDSPLDLDEGKLKSEVERAMEGHILAQAEIVGLYHRA